MKVTMYNVKQGTSIDNIINTVIDCIYSLRYGYLDSEKGSQGHKDYYNQFTNLDSLIEIAYNKIINKYYSNGISDNDKEILMRQIKKYCTKYQKEILVDLV